MDTCICMAKSLCCPPETITTLLVGYTQEQNKKWKKKKNCTESPASPEKFLRVISEVVYQAVVLGLAQIKLFCFII